MLDTISFSLRHVLSISAWPVRKTRMSPSGWLQWMSIAVCAAASMYWSLLPLCCSMEWMISTGKQRPLTLKSGAPWKYWQNFCPSSVAEVTTSFSGGSRRVTSPFRMPNSRSVFRLRSWASSSTSTPYCLSCGSSSSSLSSVPSVTYFMRVRREQRSSKRTAYPTSSPRSTAISSATRRATLTAATRRGWVTHIWRPSHRPASCRICAICVVLPLPVSPMTTTTRLAATAAAISPACPRIGSVAGSIVPSAIGQDRN